MWGLLSSSVNSNFTHLSTGPFTCCTGKRLKTTEKESCVSPFGFPVSSTDIMGTISSVLSVTSTIGAVSNSFNNDSHDQQILKKSDVRIT